MTTHSNWRKRLLLPLTLAFLTLGAALPAAADDGQQPGTDICTTFANRLNDMNTNGNYDSGCAALDQQQGQGAQGGQGGDQSTGSCGILSSIYIYIKGVLDNATEHLFDAFVGSDNYQHAVLAAVTLSIIFFGVAFTVGVMQISFGQVLVRLMKLGIIFTLISPGGWDFFNTNVVGFFSNGTDQLVSGVVQIATGIQPPDGATPFYAFDRIADFLIQPDTLIAIMGSLFNGGPFGALMGGMMMIAMMGFMKLLVNALKLYAVAFVARSLLLGLAPIFIVFLLFERTKNLFISWLNALLTMSLQPILMFTFLSFFIILIQTAATDMFSAELCWTEFKSSEGTNEKWSFWRFVDPTTKSPITSDMTWNGAIDCLLTNGSQGQGGTACQEFPINIINVLSFLILVYLAGRFAEGIDRIASELSNAYLLLDTGGKMDQFLSQQSKGGMSGLLSKANPTKGRPNSG